LPAFVKSRREWIMGDAMPSPLMRCFAGFCKKPSGRQLQLDDSHQKSEQLYISREEERCNTSCV